MSKNEVTESISRVNISKAQRESEHTPSEPILPPKPIGDYDVDERVRAGKIGLEYKAKTANSCQLFL